MTESLFGRIISIHFLLRVSLLSGFLLGASSAEAQRNVVVVRPKEISDVLVNPGMGITTFQRFNGQEPNPPLKWSEIGPVSKLPQAATRPDFPDTSVSYCRWYWNVLEPEPGKFNWAIIDLAIEEARAHGQKLAVRLMPYSNEDPLPEWFRKSGAKRGNKDSDKDGKIWQPDFADPLYFKYWSELVAAAGARYDGNPYLDSVDISSVGYWGEGWSPYMPSFSAQKSLIDIWLDAFKHTPLLMNFDEPDALTYGTKHGAGWRLDCWGDMRVDSNDPYFPAEMLEIYPQQIVRTGIQDVWQRSPVSLETCYTVPGWKERGYDVDYIIAQGLRWHVSTVNIKSSPIPSGVERQVRRVPEKNWLSIHFAPAGIQQEGSVRHHDARAHVVAQRRNRADLRRIRSRDGATLAAKISAHSNPSGRPQVASRRRGLRWLGLHSRRSRGRELRCTNRDARSKNRRSRDSICERRSPARRLVRHGRTHGEK